MNSFITTQDDASASSPETVPVSPESQAALERYRESVEDLRKVKSKKAIPNGIPEHAAILFASFFNHAEKRVSIFCQNLSAKVFGNPDVVRAAKAAIKKSVSIDIILQTQPESSPFLDLLKSAGVRYLIAQPPISDFSLNFAVVDQTSIRVEPERGKCEAQAVMYAPESAAKLGQYFDDLWSSISENKAAAV